MTPNHPEYPGAHGTNTPAMAAVFSGTILDSRGAATSQRCSTSSL
jgi:hypothetical protein